MRQQIVIFACLCSALVYALPVSDNSNTDGLQLVQIPLGNNKELDILSLDEDGRLSERSKRTIGILRELFPELTKQVEDQVNVLVGQVIRTLGPAVLRTAIQGNANRAQSDFDADFDDDDDDDDTGSRVQIELPSFDPNDDEDLKDDNNLNNGDNAIDLNALNEQLQETIRVARQTASENSVTSDATSDQDAAESKSPAIDELTLDAEDDDGDDRNKRFLPFGFGGSGQAQASAGASGGGGAGGAGSGNFLFDIIRRTADRAARAAGTVYRVVAGTETLDLNETGSQKFMTTTKTHQQGQFSKFIDRTARTINNGLFSGSVQTPQGDERANEAAPSTDGSNQGAPPGGAGYTEGIPGPVTRLVVLANRGLANLIQDLILRVAATSERLVNFKARLITSLI